MEHNIFYEDKDVEVKLLGGEGMDDFLSDAKEKVQKKSSSNKKTKSEAKKGPIEFDPDLCRGGYYPYYGLRDHYDLCLEE